MTEQPRPKPKGPKGRVRTGLEKMKIQSVATWEQKVKGKFQVVMDEMLKKVGGR